MIKNTIHLKKSHAKLMIVPILEDMSSFSALVGSVELAFAASVQTIFRSVLLVQSSFPLQTKPN